MARFQGFRNAILRRRIPAPGGWTRPARIVVAAVLLLTITASADGSPTEFVCEIRASGGDYPNLSSWEDAIQSDLTVSSTKVFGHGGVTGNIPDGSVVTGKTSGAKGTVKHATSTQILITDISGTFQSGEELHAGNGWWNNSYEYRQQITVVNNIGSPLPKGYSVNVSVNTQQLVATGKMRTDGDDARITFYNTTDSTWYQLDRVNMTNFNTASTRIWFKTQSSISAGGLDGNYYIYYGCPEGAGTPPTDRSNVYDFWDDFDDASLGSEWTFSQIGGASGSYTESGTVLMLNATNSGDLWGTSDNFLFLSISRNYDVLAESYTSGWGGSHGTWSKMGGVQLRQSFDANSTNRIMSPVYSATGATNSYRLSTGGTTSEQTTATQPMYNRLSRIGGTSRAWYSTDGVSWTELGSQISFSDGLSDPVRLGIHLAGLSSSSHWVEVDWFKVRRYVEPEPSTILGSEEIATWWNSNYRYRKKITATNNVALSLAKGYSANVAVDTGSLVSAGKMQADGDDARIVWWNSTSSSWLELDRVNATNFNTTDTRIWFQTQRDIPASGSDDNYHLYYGYSGAANPPNNASNVWTQHEVATPQWATPTGYPFAHTLVRATDGTLGLFTYGTTGSYTRLYRSIDNGASWIEIWSIGGGSEGSAHLNASDNAIHWSTGAVYRKFTYNSTTKNWTAGPELTVDGNFFGVNPSILINGSTIYVAYGNETASGGIMIQESSNGGNTWSAPLQICSQVTDQRRGVQLILWNNRVSALCASSNMRYFNYFNGTAWQFGSSGQQIGGSIFHNYARMATTTGTPPNQRLHVVAYGMYYWYSDDGNLWTQASNAWDSETFQQTLTSDGTNTYLFRPDASNNIIYRKYDGSSWGSPVRVSKTQPASPIMAQIFRRSDVDASYQIHFLFEDGQAYPDERIWHSWRMIPEPSTGLGSEETGPNYVTLTNAGDSAIAVAEVYDDWASGLNDRVTIDGWTTNATSYVKVTVPQSQRHNGTADTGAFIDPTTSGHVFTINQDYTIVEWLEITDWTGDSAEAFRVNGNHTKIGYCIIHDSNAGSDGDGVYVGTDGITIHVYNSIFYNIERCAIHNQGPWYPNTVFYIYNVAVYNVSGHDSYGSGRIKVGAGTMHLKNVMVFRGGYSSSNPDYQSTAEYGGSYGESTSNTASDSTAPGTNAVNNAVGTDYFVSLAAGSVNLHLLPTAPAIDSGVDLSGGPDLSFSDDIDGQTRSLAWDRGADEYHGLGSGINWFVNSDSKVHAPTTGSWQDIDLSTDPDILTGATGVILEIINEDASNAYTGQVRAKGSTDDRTAGAKISPETQIMAFVKLDSDKVFQAYRDSAAVKFYVRGYIGGNVTLFTNAVYYDPGSAYTTYTYDTSGAGVPGNSIVILELYDDSDGGGNYATYQFRRNGDADWQGTYGQVAAGGHQFIMIGVDDLSRFQHYHGAPGYAAFYLHGYLENKGTWKGTPSPDIQSVAGSWADANLTGQTSAEADVAMVYVESGWTSTQPEKVDLHTDGSNDDQYAYGEIWYDQPQSKIFYLCGLGPGQVLEYKAESDAINIYVLGYTEPEPRRALNLRIRDWDLTDNIQDATVYVTNSSGTFSKISDGAGWANFTKTSGSNEIKVNYYGFWVNGTFTVEMDVDRTIDLRCNLFDVVFTIMDNNNRGFLVGANVTAFNSTSIEMNNIRTGATDSAGQVTLANLPNGTLTITVYDQSPSASVISNVTRLVSNDGQTETVFCGSWATSTNNFSICVHIAAATMLLPIVFLPRRFRSMLKGLRRHRGLAALLAFLTAATMACASLYLLYSGSTLNFGVKASENIVYVKPDGSTANLFSQTETFYRSVKNVIANTSYGIKNTYQGWWDDSYTYRKKVTITNNAGITLVKGFSVNLSVNTQQLVVSGRMQADGDDARIVWWNSSSSSWVELDRVNRTNFNATATQIWFKLQEDIPAGSSDSDYYMYYGCASAAGAPNNGSKVYLFEDLFNRAASSTVGYGWIEEETSGADARIAANSLVGTNVLDLYGVDISMDTIALQTVESMDSTGRCAWEFGFVWDRDSSEGSYEVYMQLGNSTMSQSSPWTGVGAFVSWAGTGTSTTIGIAASAHEMMRVYEASTPTEIEVVSGGANLTLEIDFDATNFKFYRAGALKGTYNFYQTLSTYDTIRFVSDRINPSNIVKRGIDYARVYLVMDPIPSVNLASEEIRTWWNSSYRYRKKITVTNNIASTLMAGYSVHVTVDTSSLVACRKMRGDGYDARIVFYNVTDSTYYELDRVNATNFNTADTKIWFKTQKDIATSSSDGSYYLYYGYPAAESPPADASNVYVWFDNFSTDTRSNYSIDRHALDWHGSGVYTAFGYDSANQRITYDTGDNYAGDLMPIGVSEQDVYAEMTMGVTGSYPIHTTQGLLVRWQSNTVFYGIKACGGSYTPRMGIVENSRTNNLASNDATYHPMDGSPFKMGVAVWGSTLKMWYGDSTYSYQEWATTTDTSISTGGGIAFLAAQSTGWLDDLLIRKYVEPEPSTSLASEESVGIDIAVSIDSLSDTTRVTYFNVTLVDSTGAKRLNVTWTTGDSLPKESQSVNMPSGVTWWIRVEITGSDSVNFGDTITVEIRTKIKYS